MRVDKTCKTCGFDSNGVCGMYSTCKEDEECDDWEASLEYYTEITKKAPWYIKGPYDRCKISYEKFLDLLQQDEQGVDVEINIYDAIEKVYELNSVELAGVLDVSMGVLGYASTQKTIPKRKRQFSSRLHIPEWSVMAMAGWPIRWASLTMPPGSQKASMLDSLVCR